LCPDEKYQTEALSIYLFIVICSFIEREKRHGRNGDIKISSQEEIFLIAPRKVKTLKP